MLMDVMMMILMEKIRSRHFAHSLRREMLVAPWVYPFKVHLSSTCPSFVKTNLVSKQAFRFSEPLIHYTADDVAEATLTGIRRRQFHIYVWLLDLIVASMDSCCPMLLDSMQKVSYPQEAFKTTTVSPFVRHMQEAPVR